MAEQPQAFLRALCEQARVLKKASELSQAFVALVKHHSVDDLPVWPESALQSGCNEMCKYAISHRE